MFKELLAYNINKQFTVSVNDLKIIGLTDYIARTTVELNTENRTVELLGDKHVQKSKARPVLVCGSLTPELYYIGGKDYSILLRNETDTPIDLSMFTSTNMGCGPVAWLEFSDAHKTFDFVLALTEDVQVTEGIKDTILYVADLPNFKKSDWQHNGCCIIYLPSAEFPMYCSVKKETLKQLIKLFNKYKAPVESLTMGGNKLAHAAKTLTTVYL